MIKALCIIGAGVIAGTVVYAFLDKNRKESASANIQKKKLRVRKSGYQK